jgi:protein-L-isoaspartate(D-aspartate) O-methyltransferase
MPVTFLLVSTFSISVLIIRYMKVSPHIENAIKNVDRKDFVSPEHVDKSDKDVALPIGFGQTISQPSTVSLMLELLELKSGLKALDVGAGSGWTTALMANIVGPKGEIVGVEIIPELVEFGQKNLSKYNKGLRANIFYVQDQLGYPLIGPYQRILVSAASKDIPEELLAQLSVDGIMVIPISNSIWKIVKKSLDGTVLEKTEYPGYVFVPLKK